MASPLVPFLHHSDCDGVLTPAECRSVAPALRDVLTRWEEINDDRDMGLRLCDLMDACAAQGKVLEFR